MRADKDKGLHMHTNEGYVKWWKSDKDFFEHTIFEGNPINREEKIVCQYTSRVEVNDNLADVLDFNRFVVIYFSMFSS